MKVTSESRHQELRNIQRPSALPPKEAADHTESAKDSKASLGTEPDLDTFSDSLKSQSSDNTEKSGGNFKAKSSAPDDSVGELAAMLARAETRMDVQQVASKAMRALANLKMSAVASEGKDAKKIAQMIKRMEKLIKRIQKKLQHLGKEEQLEIRQKRAEKEKQEQKAEEIRKELKARRKKRKKDEQEYAKKELGEDAKNAVSEAVSGLTDAISASSPTASLTANGAPASVPELSSLSADAAMADAGSIDISV